MRPKLPFWHRCWSSFNHHDHHHDPAATTAISISFVEVDYGCGGSQFACRCDGGLRESRFLRRGHCKSATSACPDG